MTKSAGIDLQNSEKYVSVVYKSQPMMFGYGYPDRLGHLQTDLPQVITLGTEVRLTKLERRDICSIVADQGKPGNV